MSSEKSYPHLAKHIPRTKGLLLLTVVCMTVSFPTAFGYDSMMMSSLNALPYYQDYFGITNVTSNLNTASMWVGEIVALFFVQILASRWGRRVSILIGLVFVFLGTILQSAAQNTAMFVIARIILGFGFTYGSVAVPVLVSELCPIKFRGFLLGSFFSCFSLGSIIASAVTYGTRDIESTWCWRLPSIIQGVPAILSALFVLIAPESPRYLIKVGREEEAREIIAIVEEIEPHSEYINEIVVKCQSEQAVSDMVLWGEVFKGKNNHRRLVIGIVHAVLTELGGSSVCSYYQSVLLEQAGITDVKQKLQVGICVSCWCFLFCLGGSRGFDMFGRKTMAIVGTTGMIVAFFIMGGLIKARNDDASISPYGSVSMIFIFDAFYSMSWSALNYCYSPEIWPNRHRVLGVTWFSFWSDCFGLLANFTLPIAMENMGFKFYFTNAGYNIFFLVIIYFLFVETRGVPLEEIETLFDQAPWGGFGNKFFAPSSLVESDECEVIEVEASLKA
ncbi:unnamed protein product [Kuraishia capsulata CBS 1993]|uniref:Major facilitator superfamily (MFS) profile domain-containing protein n=1 Tax=Kuraishia capsulata CBS 1993 TaxID=1382522 RepID=W6MLH8_9ASCO|nr:uncharacterized protein KUCA_T00002945001 [Kuraishia capsulata CBS 1993]CDK26968.1 unnamed protein product [Kuraishia capsulata CBS 1993]